MLRSVRSGRRESTYKSHTHPFYDFVSKFLSFPTSGVDIKPVKFGQVSEDKHQVITARPMLNMLQPTAGRGNCTIFEPLKEEVGGRRATTWHDEGFNGPLTLADNQRGGIKTLRAGRSKEEDTQERGKEELQDAFVFDLYVFGMN